MVRTETEEFDDLFTTEESEEAMSNSERQSNCQKCSINMEHSCYANLLALGDPGCLALSPLVNA